MPLFKTRSAAVFGIDAQPVDVEVDHFRGGVARDFMRVGMWDASDSVQAVFMRVYSGTCAGRSHSREGQVPQTEERPGSHGR